MKLQGEEGLQEQLVGLTYREEEQLQEEAKIEELQ